MALIKCPECGKEISDKSKACVHCGFPLDEYTPEPIEPNDPIIEVPAIEERLPVQEEVVSKPVSEIPETEGQESSNKSNTIPTQNRSLKYIVIAVIVVVVGWFVVNNLILLPQKYSKAEQLLENGQYTEAIAAFEKLGSYNNSTLDKEYAIALSQYYSEEYAAALEHFEALGDHRNSKAYFESIVYKPVYTKLDADGKNYTIDWSYDENGNLVYFVESSEVDKTFNKDFYGKIAWQLRRTFQYDAAGNITSRRDQHYFYEELTSTSTYTYTYSFNEDGTISEQQCVYMSNSKTMHSTTTYEYDENGRVIGEQYRSSGTDSDTQYEYNSKGLVSKEIYTQDNGYTEVHDYSYDRYGNLYKDSYTFDNTNTEGGPTECVSTYWHERYEVVAVNKPVF